MMALRYERGFEGVSVQRAVLRQQAGGEGQDDLVGGC